MKSKLNQETIDKLSYAVTLGLSKEGAARYAGISVKTLYRWLGEAEENPEDENLQALSEALDNAKAVLEVELITKLKSAAEETKSWQGFSHLLKKRIADGWADVSREEMMSKIFEDFIFFVSENYPQDNSQRNWLKDVILAYAQSERNKQLEQSLKS